MSEANVDSSVKIDETLLDKENALRGIQALLLACHVPGTHCRLAVEAHLLLERWANDEKAAKAQTAQLEIVKSHDDEPKLVEVEDGV